MRVDRPGQDRRILRCPARPPKTGMPCDGRKKTALVAAVRLAPGCQTRAADVQRPENLGPIHGGLSRLVCGSLTLPPGFAVQCSDSRHRLGAHDDVALADQEIFVTGDGHQKSLIRYGWR